ncbi:MAG: alkyl hydroperoxide reductase subunit F [Eubacteriales bacterium]|nr:alkyl hydroperoxide reductase subunit F [Eubacteriales bacterium]
MQLEQAIKDQLKTYLSLLEREVSFSLSLGEDEKSRELKSFIEQIVAMDDRLSITETDRELKPSFAINSADIQERVIFAGVPLGHEFSSFVLALLQVAGRAPKISGADVARIKSISEAHDFETFVSLSCHNCPEVVQSLNIMAVLNPKIRHTMIEGSTFKDLAEAREVMAVPQVFEAGESIMGGRMVLAEILDQLAGKQSSEDLSKVEPFDVLVVGGGPAGASAAIYAARKGIRTGLVAKTIGGQVNETLGIENLIATPYIEGPKLAEALKTHMDEYDIQLIDREEAVKLERIEGEEYPIHIELSSGAVLRSKTLVIATGARWRLINIPGETEFKTKGVAYCPHCDGPLFKDKKVAVIGGGNSGVEAALDLAGICSEVHVLEFLPQLKADQVLQERLREQANVTIHTNAQTLAIEGSTKVERLRFKDRVTGEEQSLDLSGVFILIGLMPNTEWLDGTLELSKMKEIVADPRCQTSMKGVFAAGDCSTTAYKQIIISMGTGATAALSAFDDLIRMG